MWYDHVSFSSLRSDYLNWLMSKTILPVLPIPSLFHSFIFYCFTESVSTNGYFRVIIIALAQIIMVLTENTFKV